MQLRINYQRMKPSGYTNRAIFLKLVYGIEKYYEIIKSFKRL